MIILKIKPLKTTGALLCFWLAAAGFSCGKGEAEKDFSVYLGGYEQEYFVYVNREEHTLRVFTAGGIPVKEYPVATGKEPGDKLYKGDFRTPAGAYNITEIYSLEEPWYVKEAREKATTPEKNTMQHRKAEKEYTEILKEHIKNRGKIRHMNTLFLSADEGHFKFGTNESLGDNSYGPVFMRLSYPNTKDTGRYERAKKEGKIPKDQKGEYLKTGSGIAIHGTNDEPSIGHNASEGCIRMKNSDVLELLNYVRKETAVIIE